MKLRQLISYPAWPAYTIAVLAVSLLLVAAVQLFIYGYYESKYVNMEMTKPAKSEPEEPLTVENKLSQANKMFLPDGTLHFVYDVPCDDTKQPGNRSNLNDEDRQIEVYDVNKQLIWQGVKKELPFAYLGDYAYNLENRPWSYNKTAQGLKRSLIDFPETPVVPVLDDNQKILERWRYDPRRRIFEGYDYHSRRIGYWGTNGFCQSPESAIPFEKFKRFDAANPLHINSPDILWQTDHRIDHMNFAQRRTELFFDARDSTIKDYQFSNFLEDRSREKLHYRPMIIIKLDRNKYHLILQKPDEQRDLELPQELIGHHMPSFFATDQGVFFESYGTEGMPDTDNPFLFEQWLETRHEKPVKKWLALSKLDADNQLKLLNRYEWSHTFDPLSESELWANPKLAKIKSITTVISPIPYDWLWQHYLKTADTGTFNKWWIFKIIFDRIRPTHQLANLILSAIMALAVLAHAWPRRRGWAGLIFWIAFAAIFNLAGLITYLGLNHTKVVRCAACGKRRALTRPDCPACGSPLPAPAPRDIDLIRKPAPAAATA